MSSIKLLPNSNRLRQLIRDNGEEWDVKGPLRDMPCINGFGIPISSKDGKHLRNIGWRDIGEYYV